MHTPITPAAPHRLLGLACALAAALGFACSLVLARISYDHGSNSQTVMLVRFALVALLMLAWNRWRGHSLALAPKLVAGCCALGVFYFIGIGAYLTSVNWLPVSLAVLVFYTFPILIALLSAALARRWPQPLEMLALLVAFAGLALALEVRGGVELHPLGLALACCAALGVTLNMVSSGYLLQRIPTTVFSFYLTLTTGTLSALAVLASGGPALPQSTAGWWAFGAMLATFIIAFIGTYNGIRLLGAVRLSTIMNLEPLATILIAVAALGESLSGRQTLGGGIVLAAILLAQWPQWRAARRQRAAAAASG